MMDNIERWVELEQDLSSEYGPFELFALFLREDARDKWDLVVAAPWLQDGRMKGLRRIAERIQEQFSEEDLLNLSRIVIIDQENPALPAIQGAIRLVHGTAEVKDSSFFGLEIEHAYIITSQRPNAMSGQPVA